ncbi:DUF742 domain-containing protein [Streptomyces macrosporus]|uniref:DUF742 domain-containing protein n=1 Tax=Streptomyces macrosporus TaxID=44032 RepID=A0ABP5XNS6_9ACTN
MTAADRPGGPVRPYVITRGRVQPPRRLPVETLLEATDTTDPLPVTASRHHRRLLSVCRNRLALVEAAAHLKEPVSVVTVLVCDLIDSGHLTVCSSAPLASDRPDTTLLQEVLDGLRRKLSA